MTYLGGGPRKTATFEAEAAQSAAANPQTPHWAGTGTGNTQHTTHNTHRIIRPVCRTRPLKSFALLRSPHAHTHTRHSWQVVQPPGHTHTAVRGKHTPVPPPSSFEFDAVLSLKSSMAMPGPAVSTRARSALGDISNRGLADPKLGKVVAGKASLRAHRTSETATLKAKRLRN